MRFLLYYNQEQIEDSIIIPNPFVREGDIQEYNEMDNWTGQAKKVRGGLYFTGKDALKHLKYHLRVQKNNEYEWNGKNLFTPKKEVTQWIDSLSHKVIYEQEINRLQVQNDELQQDVDEYEFLYERLAHFMPNFNKLSHVIEKLRYHFIKLDKNDEQAVKGHKEFVEDTNSKIKNLLK